MERQPRNPTPIEAHLLIARLLAGPFPTKRKLAEALGIKWRTFTRITSRNAAIGNMPRKYLEALRSLAEASLPQGKALNLGPSENDRDKPHSVEELIDLVLQAQQPGRHLRDDACDALARNLIRIRTPALERNLAAVLMAQLALLDGAPGVSSTFHVCKSTLEDLASTTSSDNTACHLQSLACTALGRATATIAAMRPGRQARMAGIGESIKWFLRAGARIGELRKFVSIPALPLVWAIDEHPDAPYARGDGARRTPYSQFAGPTHRYLLWMKLALAYEHMVNDVPNGHAATRLLEEAERAWREWTDGMVKRATASEKLLTWKGWTLRLRVMQYLKFVLLPTSGSAAQQQLLVRDIEQLLADAPDGDYFRPIEFATAKALITTRTAIKVRRRGPQQSHQFSQSGPYFAIDDADARLFPLIQLNELVNG